MAELNARDTKLVQYLNEALTKEKQLEQALAAHAEMTNLTPYRKRLRQHLSETKRHAREVERRIKKLGGEAEGITGVVHEAAGVVQDVAAKGAALAQGPIHMVRGTSEQEVLLKNARTEFKEEAEEIGTYTMIQNLAEKVGDRDTANLAKAILREEKRMAGFLEKLIPRLTSSVVQAEIPARERNGGRRRKPSSRRQASGTRAGGTRPRGTARTSGTRSGPKRSTAARRGASRSTSARGRTGATRAGGTTRRSGTASRASGGRASSARSSGARSSGGRTTARRGTSRS